MDDMKRKISFVFVTIESIYYSDEHPPTLTDEESITEIHHTKNKIKITPYTACNRKSNKVTKMLVTI